MVADPFSPLRPSKNPESSRRPGRLSDVHMRPSRSSSVLDAENVPPLNLHAQLKAFERGLRENPTAPALSASRDFRPPSFLEREARRPKAEPTLSTAQREEIFMASVPKFTARTFNKTNFRSATCFPKKPRPTVVGTFGRASTGRLLSPPRTPKNSSRPLGSPSSDRFFTPN